MSRLSTRLAATSLGLALGVALSATQAFASNPDNTWVPLARLPDNLASPVFALAVNPTDAQNVLVGSQSGSIYRSGDGGATWREVRHDPAHPVLSIAFNPYRGGSAVAGTRGGGVLKSTDAGQTWAVQSGTEKTVVRSFGFAKSLTIAGTDEGILIGRDSTGWSPIGLSQLSVSALAVAAVNDPSRIVAGADTSKSSEPLPLYSSGDGGATWNALKAPSTAASMVSALAAGPLPTKGDTRPLLMGTNAALYQSADNGQTWSQLTGGGVLPPTDFVAAGFVTTHPERYYVASDGGASDRGGVWSTSDSGQHFASLQVPVSAVTALAVSNDEQPTVYVASFRPVDHAVFLFSYRDTGGLPQPAPALPSPKPVAGAVAKPPAPPPSDWLLVLMTGPEAPFLALGAGAGLVLLLTLVAYVGRARRRRI